MKNLKMLIIILIMFAVGLTGVIIILSLQDYEGNDVAINTTDSINNNSNIINDTIIQEEALDTENPTLTFNTELVKVQSQTTLYSLSKNINKYFNYIKEGNAVAVNELGGNSIYAITNNCKYALKQAYITSNEYLAKYYTYGVLYIANGNLTSSAQEVYMVVYRDLQNDTYKVETVANEQIEELSQEEKLSIPKQGYNNFETEHVDNVRQAEIYLEDYSFQIFNNAENAYNLLDEAYRNKRFGSVEEFIKHINLKQNQLIDIALIQYNVLEEDDTIIYMGTDKYGNYYKIIETAYMEYTMMLDNYTLKDYSDYSTEEQIRECAETFILMLNSKDYTNAYNLLEPTFRANNFPTEQDFENYAMQNFFERNVISTREVIDAENGMCLVTMREGISTLSNKMQKQFKVNISEGIEFTIEFNI